VATAGQTMEERWHAVQHLLNQEAELCKAHGTDASAAPAPAPAGARWPHEDGSIRSRTIAHLVCWRAMQHLLRQEAELRKGVVPVQPQHWLRMGNGATRPQSRRQLAL
jgi:hypothetical protein